MRLARVTIYPWLKSVIPLCVASGPANDWERVLGLWKPWTYGHYLKELARKDIDKTKFDEVFDEKKCMKVGVWAPGIAFVAVHISILTHSFT